MPATSQLHYFDHRDCKIPVKVYVEYRRNTRYALGRKHFIFRIPRQLSNSQREETFNRGLDWAQSVLVKKPKVIETFKPHVYRDGDLINCFDRKWKLIYSDEFSRPQLKIKAGDEENSLLVSASLAPENGSPSDKLSKLVRKAMADHYEEIICLRAVETAGKHQLPRPEECRLKYMSSRWGSCHTRGEKITINTRLLLAPEKILDAVIIHELCHFIYPNHSADFWRLVRRSCPDYSERNRWLKTNGYQLRL